MNENDIKICKEIVVIFNKASFNVTSIELINTAKILHQFANMITEHEKRLTPTIKEEKKSRIRK